MGVDLVLKKGCATYSLYRSYHYKIDNEFIKSREEWERKHEYFESLLKAKVNALIGYTPKNKEELEDLRIDFEDYAEDILTEIVRLGRISLLLDLGEEGFTYYEDY